MNEQLTRAFELFDQANSADPNLEEFNGQSYPKQVLYAQRMTETLNEFYPDAPEALQLAARSQHICRWESPRNSYPEGRAGYLKWRADLKKFHASKAREILSEIGYQEEIIAEVEFLLQKKQLKKHENTQALEDVICLVFLQHYFEAFATKHDDEKVISILQKTWNKMSEKGHQAALKIDFTEKPAQLIAKALG